ncbi:unnamed protein product [Calypogeia fissa]
MADSMANALAGVWNKLQAVFSTTASSSCTWVPKLTELHEMVYEVHSPPNGEKPELEIVFCHGLQLNHKEAYATSWMSHDNSEMWPKTWLVEEFPRARILTISYDSTIKRTNESGRLDMFLTAENLLSALTSSDVRLGKAKCPIVLVGHCLGGLLLKELCLHANKILSEKREDMQGMQRIHDFFGNLRGMFFYGTPHNGSLLGNKLHRRLGSALLNEIKILNASGARRNEGFRDLKSRQEWVTYGISEARETFVECLQECIQLVPEASSRFDMDGYYSADADHFDICKPRGKHSSSFSCLKDFLQEIHQEGIYLPGVVDDAESGGEYYVDFCSRAEEFKNMLAQRDAQTIFIVGLDGIGKTSLAEKVFHDISHSFEVTCFVHLDDIGAQSSGNEQVLRKVPADLRQQDKGLKYDDFSIPRYLKNKNVLMILDNVQSRAQLAVLNRAIWLKGGSGLIVVAKDALLGTLSHTYEVKFLLKEESKQLFCHYAFAGREVPQHLVCIIDEVINQCGDFPWVLKRLALYCSRKDVNDQDLWRELIIRLKDAEEVASGHDYRLWAKLRSFYDDLTQYDQEIFLDVATVFCGWPLELARDIWSACRRSPSLGWNNLKDGFLVNVDDHGRIFMQNLLRYLGLSIACPRSSTVDKWRHVSEHTAARELIANFQGVVEARSLKLEVLEHERLTLRRTAFIQYARLEVLILDGVDTAEDNLELPSSLVYLQWKNASFKACPVDFSCSEKLVAVDLQDCKVMEVPPWSLAKVKTLKWLDFKGCPFSPILPELMWRSFTPAYFSNPQVLRKFEGMTDLAKFEGMTDLAKFELMVDLPDIVSRRKFEGMTDLAKF